MAKGIGCIVFLKTDSNTSADNNLNKEQDVSSL